MEVYGKFLNEAYRTVNGMGIFLATWAKTLGAPCTPCYFLPNYIRLIN
jgi:hypothetical protein